MKLRNHLSLKVLLAFVAVSLTFFSCKDYNDLDVEQNSGDADFTTVVAVGNSLTAGFQSNALFESAQRYSFPAIVAGQMAGVNNFEQPIISDPGIGGRLELDGSDLSGPIPTEEQGTPQNADLDRPYNNLGIPGAILADFTGTDLPGLPYSARQSNNPFFDIVLRDMGSTQAAQMTSLEPTFVMFWLGNNDVLGYVTSGGNTPYTPAGPQGFAGLYQASMQQISATGADAVLYNIPNVTTIPFVFLVNNLLLQEGTITVNQNNNFALVTPQGDVPIWVETTDPSNPGVVQDTTIMNAPNPGAGQPGGFFLLSARETLPQLFQNGTGLSPNNPIPHSLVLDNGETTQAVQLVNQYNQTISSLASSNGFALVDINTAFSDIIANGGITVDGVSLTPTPGSLFSFDGVHPANQGHGIVANLTIEAINDTYNANLPPVDVSEIPQGIPIQ